MQLTLSHLFTQNFIISNWFVKSTLVYVKGWRNFCVFLHQFLTVFEWLSSKWELLAQFSYSMHAGSERNTTAFCSTCRVLCVWRFIIPIYQIQGTSLCNSSRLQLLKLNLLTKHFHFCTSLKPKQVNFVSKLSKRPAFKNIVCHLQQTHFSIWCLAE